MSRSPAVRKAALTVHVTSSVGWLGAVVVAVALSAVIAGSSDDRLVQACYLVLDRIGWWVLVPLAVASLVSGILESLLTPWGLVRHWWVVVKLVLTVLATGVLLLYTGTLGRLAAEARIADGSAAPASSSPLVHSLGALVVLLVAVVLSVHKPRGLTRYGWHVQQAGRAPRA